MQWDNSASLGFSTAKSSDLYLPVDPADDAPTVKAQEENPASLLHTVRTVLALRHQEEDLQADGDFSVICSEPGKPFVYRRGKLLCAVNPNGKACQLELSDSLCESLAGETIYKIGESSIKDGNLHLGDQAFVIIK